MASYVTDRESFGVALADLNGDGKTDMAVMNALMDAVIPIPPAGTGGDGGAFGGTGGAGGPRDPGSVSVFLNAGNGTFAAPAQYPGRQPNAVALGDLNGDGKPDLAVAGGDPQRTSGSVNVFINAGNGAFGLPVSYGAGSAFMAIAFGDLNGGGGGDLAVADSGLYPTDNGNVSLFFNNGGGTFIDARFQAGNNPNAVEIGDLNGDGRPDLAVSHSGGVGVLLNGGGGAFSAATYFAAGTNPSTIALGDLNGDGRADLVLSSWMTDNVSVLFNVGGGAFASAINYAAGDDPSSVAMGDVDGDGRPDLAVVSGEWWSCRTVSVLINQGNGSFSAGPRPVAVIDPPPYPFSANARSIGMADLDGDGRLDLAVAKKDGVGVLLAAPR
jgi:hypothetical protein